MEINIKEYTKEELISLLKETSSIICDVISRCGIDPSKFLRDDLSINLELIEFAITSIVQDGADIVYLYNIEDYYKLRGIQLDERRRKEESGFILGFCRAIANEISQRGDIHVYYYDEHIQ
jgi:hypothetical protein